MGILIAKTGSHEGNFGFSWVTLFGGQNDHSLWNSVFMFALPVLTLKSKTLDRQVWNGHEVQKLHFVHNMVLRQIVTKLTEKNDFLNETV